MDEENRARALRHYTQLARESDTLACVFAFPDGDVLLIVDEVCPLLEAIQNADAGNVAVTSEQFVAASDPMPVPELEWVDAMRADPHNGDRVQWVGVYDDPFGRG